MGVKVLGSEILGGDCFGGAGIWGTESMGVTVLGSWNFVSKKHGGESFRELAFGEQKIWE